MKIVIREMKIAMREIKFRGKLMLGKHRWVKGSYVRVNDYHLIIPGGTHSLLDYKRCEPETIGQYTGLKDRNGREIYEGDIVDMRPRYSQSRCIEYSDGQWICVDADFGWIPLIEDEQIGDEMNGVEVIGNIHDNPELMKKSIKEG